MPQPHILIVDDERFFTSLLKDILKDKYYISIASSGAEALDILKKKNIDLVLLDILMPVMGGYQVCRKIKQLESTARIPVIFLTVKNEIEDQIKGFKLGAADYIDKPVSPPIIRARVATQLSLAQMNEKLTQHSIELEVLVAERTLVLNQEISDKREAYGKLHYLANYDQLTRLPNRNLFNERLIFAHKLAQRSKRSFSLLLVDLDRFKHVNDTLGHHVGDLLLEKVAIRISACLRSIDTIARLGGDEFGVIIVNLSSKEDAAIVAKKIIDSLSRYFDIQGQQIYIGASIGITSHPEDGVGYEEMLNHADMAMYEVKNKGRNSYRFFSPSLTQHANQRMMLEKDLRKALLDGDGLYLNYQPIIDIQEKIVCGVEALFRWRHPKHGQVSPAQIISIAEESDLIFEVGQWVLHTACKQYSLWKEQDLKDLDRIHIAINISTRQFSEKADIFLVVEKLLQEYHIPFHALQLEITEELMLDHSQLVMDVLVKFRDLGVQFSVDDFGTGYSSLSYLHRFPVNVLKIDRSFIHDLHLNDGSDTLIKAIIAMGQSLNLKVIAEGVETEEQLQFIQQQGCDMVQGYYFSKPVSAESFGRFIETETELF